MAKKITELPAASSVEETDVLAFVDLTDPRTTKKATIAQILELAAGTPPAGDDGDIQVKDGEAFAGLTPPEGDLVGTTEEQTLTNKTLDAAVLTEPTLQDPTIEGEIIINDFVSTTTTSVDGGVVTDVIVDYQTTTNTPTAIYEWPIEDEAITVVDAVFTCIKANATAGASYKRAMTFRSQGGTVYPIGTVRENSTDETASSWDATIDNDDQTGQIIFTGASLTTIDGLACIRIQHKLCSDPGSVFDPATTAPTGYWIDFASAPWTGTTSSGSSGGRTLVLGDAPTVGAAFGVHDSADFDGTNDYLVGGGGLVLPDLFTRPAYTYEFILEADAASAPSANPYDEPILFGENGGNMYLSFTSAGVRAGHYDDVGFKVTTPVACSTGAKHCVQVKYDGTDIMCRVDGGSWSTVAAANVTVSYSSLIPRIGANYNATAKFNGRIARVMTWNTALDDSTLDDLYTDAQENFGV
jgi:hypothetical protein